ncbi:MAG: hypothetical protein ACXVHW_00010 [Methanobacterium sp.]
MVLKCCTRPVKWIYPAYWIYSGQCNSVKTLINLVEENYVDVQCPKEFRDKY